MNILFVITSYPPATGGAQLHTHELIKKISKFASVKVCTLWNENRTDWLLGSTINAPKHPKDYDYDGIRVNRIHLNLSNKLLWAPLVAGFHLWKNTATKILAKEIFLSLKHIVKEPVDLVHNVRIGREHISWGAKFFADSINAPFVFTPNHHPRWSGWHYRAYLELYRKSDRVIAFTENGKNELTGLGVNPRSIAITGIGPILSNTAKPDDFRKKHNLGDFPVILFIGQHYTYKGFDKILESAPIVWKDFPDARFVFIGPDSDDSVSLFKRHTDKRILRLGNVDLQEKSNSLAACNIFAFPSVQESFGGVVTEAWYYGKPVIVCPIPAIRDFVSDGKDGIYVEQSPHSIAEAILHLLRNPDTAFQMGAAGREKTLLNYNWDNIAAKYNKIYSNLVGASKPKR